MKKCYLLAVMAIVSMSVHAQTADEIISKYLVAAGGKDKLKVVFSLQYDQKMTYNTGFGPIEISMTTFKEKEKLSRINASTPMLGSGFTLVTDTAGWVYVAASPFSGGEAKLERMKPEAHTAAKSQMASEGFFPELFNYASRGYTAEYTGEGKGNGKASYKIKLRKDKDERTYFIDKESGLVNTMIIKGEAAAAMLGLNGVGMGGGRSDKMEITVNYSDYKELAGMQFPSKAVYETARGSLEATISNIKLNEEIEAKWYKAE
jgi:hypothetical protein